MKRATKRTLLLRTALPLVLAVAVGCSEDILEDASEPQGVLNEGTLQDANGVEGSLIAAYRNLDWSGAGGWGHAASNWVWGSVTSDDAYKGSEATDQPAINDIEAYAWGTPGTEGYLNDKWRGMYDGVVRANATLRLLRSVVAANADEITAEHQRGIKGEALFLRAHYHFEAWRMWGRIPYYTEDDQNFREANLESNEVVTNLLRDLDSAVFYLPETPRRGQVGRVTKWAARAYRGRVLAYDAQWPAALTQLREVRNSGVYALEQSFDRVWTGFDAFDNGKETILAFQASANDGDPNGDNANYGERLNFPHSGSPFGCCGFHQPSQNLVNFYKVDAAGFPLSLSDPNWNASDAELEGGAAQPVDPRLDWTVGRDGVPYKDWGAHAATWIRAPAYGGLYSPKKPVHEKASGAGQTAGGWAPYQQNSVNIHIFRYADMLLLLAEAEVEAGSLENARAIVNEIRARAAVRVQGPGTAAANIAVPINDPSITWATYRVAQYSAADFATQAQARERVRTERRLELAMEGQRFFDLRRWGTFQTVLNAYLAVEDDRRPYLRAALPVTPIHRWFPIPQVQIDLSKVNGEETLTQNPGWGSGS